ncbi:hypothetical protein XENOCAPTIV_009647, partial [Xenoophorus captivus]
TKTHLRRVTPGHVCLQRHLPLSVNGERHSHAHADIYTVETQDIWALMVTRSSCSSLCW